MRGSTIPCLLIAAACGGLLIVSPARSQQLEELRSGVRTSPPPPQPASSGGNSDRDHDDCDDDWDCGCDGDLWLGVGYLTAMTVTSPFWGPPALVGDHYNEPGYFSHFPHEYGPGYMLIAPGEAFGLEGTRQPWPWAARGRAEYGTDFDGLEWIGGQVLVENTRRFGFDGEFRQISEELFPAGSDGLWLGDANLVFRFAQSESIVMRTGLGANWLTDDLGSDFGFNFTYGGDWFPVRPIVVSSSFDIGTLGTAFVVQLRGSVGVTYRGWEAFGGYDFLRVGSVNLHGPMAGVRWWF
jgi:hypothetical protein